jgi:hypothetical protein
VVDNGNNRIQIFNKDGIWKRVIWKQGSTDNEFNYPSDVAVCKIDGRIFVSDSKNNWI